MNKHKFKEGDWCYNEFDLNMIKELNEDGITGLTNGYIESWGHHVDELFPQTLLIKTISEEYEYNHKKIMNLKTNSLNIPDIRRKFVVMWMECCNDKKENIKKHYEKLYKFVDEITKKVNEIKETKIEGINIFSR